MFACSLLAPAEERFIMMRPLWTALVLAGSLLAPPARAQQQNITAKSPDGARLALAEKKTISVADVKTGKLLMKMAAHTKDVTALAYSPDGKMLASADQDGKVNLF